MRRREKSFWHDLGRGVETMISTLPRTSTRAAAPRSRARRESKPAESDPPSTQSWESSLISMLSAGTAAIAVSALRRWVGRSRPSAGGLVRGAVAGAGAAAAVLVSRQLWLSGPRRAGSTKVVGEVVDDLLAGIGRGVIYSALLHPIVPGPPVVKGALVGTAEYLASPLGGVFSPLQALSPLRRVPVISVLLETGDAEDDRYLTFLIHGIALGLLYGNGDGGPDVH